MIVVCSSSNELLESVLQAGGSEIRKTYEERKASTKNKQSFAIPTSNLSCKEIFFVPWPSSQNIVLLEKTIRNIMTESMQYVINQNYKSIALPPIGCDQFGMNVDSVAQIMINHIKLEKYPLDFTIVIHPNSSHVFDTFQRVNGK